MKKQTAVEWLENEFKETNLFCSFIFLHNRLATYILINKFYNLQEKVPFYLQPVHHISILQ